ncbi:MAG: hypothetical protein KA801_14840 [Syntrophorhabdaceae bacterium]|nr:hypothetical protein [Syntrophorhabdaceae bacterium]
MTVRLCVYLFVVSAAVLIHSGALAGQDCECYKLGYQAYKTNAYHACTGRPGYCAAGAGQAFEGGCIDARNENSRLLNKNGWCTVSGGSSSQGSASGGGGSAAKGVPGTWYALGNMPSVNGQCPPEYPNPKGGRCYKDCQTGSHPFWTNRGDICVQCPNGKPNRVNLTGDGRVFCY